MNNELGRSTTVVAMGVDRGQFHEASAMAI